MNKIFAGENFKWEEFASKITNWDEFCSKFNMESYEKREGDETEQKVLYLKKTANNYVLHKIWKSLVESSNNEAARMLEELLDDAQVLNKSANTPMNEELINRLKQALLDTVQPSEFCGIISDVKANFFDLNLQKLRGPYPSALHPPIVEENNGVDICETEFKITDLLDENSDIFEERMIIITGPHGSGKTSLLKKLLLESLNNIEKLKIVRRPVFPISINAPELFSILHKNKLKTIDLTHVFNYIFELDKIPEKEIILEELKQRSILLLIDRFDELSKSERTVLEKVIEAEVVELAADDLSYTCWGEKFKAQKYIIATENTSSLPANLKGCILQILPLNPKQVEEYAMSVIAENNIKINEKEFKDVRSSFFCFNLSSPLLVLLSLNYFGIISVQSRSMNTFAMIEAVIRNHIKQQKLKMAGNLEFSQIVAMNENMVYDWITLLCFVFFKLKQQSSKVSRKSIIELFALLKRGGFALDTYSYAGHYDCLIDFTGFFENVSDGCFEAKQVTIIHFLVSRFLIKGLGREPNSLTKWNNVKQTLAKYCNSDEFLDWRKTIHMFHEQVIEFIGYGVDSWNQYYLALENCLEKDVFVKMQMDGFCKSLINRGDLRFSNMSVEYINYFIHHCYEAKTLSRNAILAYLVLARQFKNMEEAKKSKWELMFKDPVTLLDQITTNIFPELEQFIVPHNVFFISTKSVEEIAKLKFISNPTLYAFLPQEAKDDRDLILTALDHNVRLYSHLEEKYREDEEVLRKVVSKDVSLLKHAPMYVRNEKKIMETLCKINPYAYKYSGFTVRKDISLASQVVKKCAKLLKYADASVREIKPIVIDGIVINSLILRYLEPTMLEDDDFVVELVKLNYFVIYRLQSLIQRKQSLKQLIWETVIEVRPLMKKLFGADTTSFSSENNDEILIDFALEISPEDEVVKKEEAEEEPPKEDEEAAPPASVPAVIQQRRKKKKACLLQ